MNAITSTYDLDLCPRPESAREAALRIIDRSECGTGPFSDCEGLDPLGWPPLARCDQPWGSADCSLRWAEEPGYEDFEGEGFEPEGEEEAQERAYWLTVLPRYLC